jgi:hypothetical protein
MHWYIMQVLKSRDTTNVLSRPSSYTLRSQIHNSHGTSTTLTSTMTMTVLSRFTTLTTYLRTKVTSRLIAEYRPCCLVVMFLAGGNKKGGIREGQGAWGFLVVSLPDAEPT